MATRKPADQRQIEQIGCSWLPRLTRKQKNRLSISGHPKLLRTLISSIQTSILANICVRIIRKVEKKEEKKCEAGDGGCLVAWLEGSAGAG